jgi:deazaflavin-dependent oxidoreductase (nitroreductase family)
VQGKNPTIPTIPRIVAAMTSAMSRLIRAFTDTHVALIRLTNGKLGARVGSVRFCILTTTGRKSGVERHNPLAWFPHDDGLVVIASAGGSDDHPAWYRNLVANPLVRVEIDGVDRPMTARTASAAEKSQIWPGIVATAKNFEGYQARTSRNIPVVILEPREN